MKQSGVIGLSWSPVGTVPRPSWVEPKIGLTSGTDSPSISSDRHQYADASCRPVVNSVSWTKVDGRKEEKDLDAVQSPSPGTRVRHFGRPESDQLRPDRRGNTRSSKNSI